MIVEELKGAVLVSRGAGKPSKDFVLHSAHEG